MKPLDEALRRAGAVAINNFLADRRHDPLPNLTVIEAIEADAMKAALASLAADGWVLVPKEPTREMLDAILLHVRQIPVGHECASAYHGSHTGPAYRAMLAAAPKPGETP